VLFSSSGSARLIQTNAEVYNPKTAIQLRCVGVGPAIILHNFFSPVCYVNLLY
jgi:hypothetical protein